jgi:hypothetical protein
MRPFSNLLFITKNSSHFSLYKPQTYIFLDQPSDSSAVNEFQKLKTLRFENPNLAVYKNSYFFLTKSTFFFFYNLYFILFQLKQL